MKRVLGCIALLVWATQAMAELKVSDAMVRDLIPGQNVAAAFFTITNTGKTVAKIVAAESNAAAMVEVHTHIHEDGMMKMRRLEDLTIEAGQTVEFKPGHLHLMMFNCDPQYFAADSVALRLITESGESVVFDAPVVSARQHAAHH